MKFEKTHSVTSNEFALHCGRNFAFPLHLHHAFECCIQLSGRSKIYVDDVEYELCADSASGNAALIFPYQTHAYFPIGEGTNVISIFSTDMVPDFYCLHEKMYPNNALFGFSFDPNVNTDNIFRQRSFAYALCGAFEAQGRTYSKENKMKNDLLRRLLIYAEENFRSGCLLRDAAASVGYDYAYISKQFKQKVGISFRQYVNLLRVNESKRLLQRTDKSIGQIMADCGFDSLRTFDRVFAAEIGCSPCAYRKAKGK